MDDSSDRQNSSLDERVRAKPSTGSATKESVPASTPNDSIPDRDKYVIRAEIHDGFSKFGDYLILYRSQIIAFISYVCYNYIIIIIFVNIRCVLREISRTSLGRTQGGQASLGPSMIPFIESVPIWAPAVKIFTQSFVPKNSSRVKFQFHM